MICRVDSGTCARLGGVFLDGTPCGIHGTCRKGKCEGSIDLILKLVASVVILVIAVIAYFVWMYIKRRSRQTPSGLPPPSGFKSLDSQHNPVYPGNTIKEPHTALISDT